MKCDLLTRLYIAIPLLYIYVSGLSLVLMQCHVDGTEQAIKQLQLLSLLQDTNKHVCMASVLCDFTTVRIKEQLLQLNTYYSYCYNIYTVVRLASYP